MASDDPAQDSVAVLAEEAGQGTEERRFRGLGTMLGVVVVVLIVLWWIFSQTTVVPDVVGQTEPAARQTLAAAKLAVGDVTEVGSAEHEVGCIAGQAPLVGARVLKGSPIDMALSTGAAGGADDERNGRVAPVGYQPTSTTRTAEPGGDRDGGGGIAPSGPWVPNVQALTEGQALARLRAAGYVATVKYGPVTSGPGKGRVYFQDPEPDAVAKRGTKVTVWVSTGGPGAGTGGDYPRPYTESPEQ